MILDAILASAVSNQDTAQVSDQDTAQVSDQVKLLIEKMEPKEYSLSELMSLLALSHRATFQKNYLGPALEARLIERAIPDKPKRPKQKYKLKK